MSDRRASRALPVPLLLVVVGALAACSPGAGDEPTTSASPTVSATPTTDLTADPAAADEAAVLDVHERFWAALVASRRGNPDPALFEGVAQGPVVENELAIATSYRDTGIVVEGEPVLVSVTTTVDGDTALVQACVDYTAWAPAGATQTATVTPVDVTATRAGDAWLVTAFDEVTGTATC